MKIIPVNFNHEIAKANRIRTLFRFLNWQIKSRICKRDIVQNWIGEAKFYVKNGETGLTQNIYVGLAEFEDMSFLMHCLRDSDYFFDVGSNSGSYSILGGAVAGAKVVAVEPIRETYKRLCQNLILNKLDKSSVALNVGLGSEIGFLEMTSTFDTTNRIVIGKSEEITTVVEISTLDEISKNMNATLIKIDVEGWETEVLKGGYKTLQNPTLLALIIELNGSGRRYGHSDTEILQILKLFSFKPYSYEPFSRSLKLLEGKNQKNSNTIFIRNEIEIMKRIKNAPIIEILGTRV